METGYEEAVATLVAVADGTTSLYFSNGGGVIGAGTHAAVAEASRALLETGRDALPALAPMEDPPLPDVGLGPTPGLDLYLDDGAALDVEVQPDPGTALDDRRSGFCRARPSRAELARQAVTCVGEAALLGVDAAEMTAESWPG